MDQNQLFVSTSPHLAGKGSVKNAMRDVIIALLPASVVAVVLFGLNALILIVLSVASAMAADIIVRKILGRGPTFKDWSAALTGLLFALTLPAIVPWWMAVVGAFVAVGIAKELLGGLGYNIFNPALVGRVFVTVSWAGLLSLALKPFWWLSSGFFDYAYPKIFDNKLDAASVILGRLDGITGATPLAIVKPQLATGGQPESYLNLLLGLTRGSIGEVSALALLIGAAYLFWRGHINWRIPFTFIGAVVVISLVTGRDPLYDVLSGGLILGAFYMATDWVTSPITPKGEIIFGLGCGILTALIRVYGGYPEGVLFAILLMNATVPLIDKYTKQRMFGEAAG